MKKDILQTLAHMAAVRTHLNYVNNLNWTNKSNVKLAQSKLQKFDNDYVNLFLEYCKEEPVENIPIIPQEIVEQLKEESDKKRGRKKVTRIENEEK